MSYEKQTWANGDVITATGLNHMEDGIADAGGGGGTPLEILSVENQSETGAVLNKTFNEIKEAFPNCYVTFGGDEYQYNVVVYVSHDLGQYKVGVGYDANNVYTVNSADGYPEMSYD